MTIAYNRQIEDERPLIQQMVTINNIKVFDHLSFARELIKRHVPSSKRKSDLINLIESIEKRAKDPFLYLAVVGEFNSGKSTFINAIIRQRLLKSACVATTASVTHITPGNKFIVIASFVDGTTIKATKNDFKSLADKLRKTTPDINSDLLGLNYLLDLMTSEPDVAETIKYIDIEVPSNNLLNNVSIIDTPGINAGAHSAEGHEKITQNVIEDIADTAIVLVPSNKPMTATLIHFLNTKARHFLHRCVFVITAMDKQDKEERNEIINFVKLKLADKLNLSDPIVFPSSAIAMIPTENSSTSTQDSPTYWKNQFEQLEVTLKKVMMQQREIIIAERLIRLLQELIQELREDLQKKKQNLTKEELLLKESSIEAIGDLLNALYNDSAEKIKKDIISLKQHSSLRKSYYSSLAKTEVSKVINEAGWVSVNDYNINIAPAVKSLIEEKGQSYLKNVNVKMRELNKTCSNICDNFDVRFKANYKNFPFLGVEITSPSLSVSSIDIPNIQFSSSRDYLERQNHEDDTGTKAGALALGVVGFCFGGPIGAALGAAIGGAIGCGAAGDSLEERQRKLCSFAGNDIDIFFDVYNKEIEKNLDITSSQLLSQLQKACRVHINEYESKVNKLIQEHKMKEINLKAEIIQINSDISELSSRKERLDDLKEILLIK